MQLSALDWWVLALYGVTILSVGLAFARRAGRGTEEYFLAGRSMPWWLIGTSMVATTFSADTPNLVTDLVRTGGVSQNWVWWAFVITGMCTVFFYAKLWRRSGVLTDIGFYELRYSGRSAAFLRGFRAVYLGVFFNVMIMATVTLAAIKIGGVLLGVGPYTVVLVAGTATVLYSATSGLWGVLVTDLLLFSVSMIGSIAAAIYALRLPEVGGLSGLMAHANVTDKLSFLPDFSDPTAAAAVFIVPIAVQWWSTWYPGAEPGGGGYVAQRMLAAKAEKKAAKKAEKEAKKAAKAAKKAKNTSNSSKGSTGGAGGADPEYNESVLAKTVAALEGIAWPADKDKITEYLKGKEKQLDKAISGAWANFKKAANNSNCKNVNLDGDSKRNYIVTN